LKHPIDIFAEGARDGVYPGGQLAVSRECQRLVTASVGVLGPSLEATHDNVIYDLASLTKPLATTLLLGRALEEGRVKLDDPVGKYVPGVAPELELQHLLEHSSGFPAHQRFDTTLPATLRPGSWDAWRHIIFKAAAVPREVPPGTRAVYSDIGFILLGAAMEIVYSMPLSIAHAQLASPLFYRDSRGAPALPIVRTKYPIAPTEGCNAGEVHDENARAMGGAAGHAGLFGTASGVLKIAEQLVLAYHGWRGGALKPETVRRMWQPSTVPGSTHTLGWDRPSKTGSSTGGRWPSHAVGHLGFTGTSVWIEPERALIVVLVTNRVCPTRANNTIRRLRPLLYDAAWEVWGDRTARPSSRPGRVVPPEDTVEEPTPGEPKVIVPDDDTNAPTAIARAHTSAPPPPVRDAAPLEPEAIDKTLEKTPALRTAKNHKDKSTRPRGPARETAVFDQEPTQRIEVPRSPEPKKKRSKRV
jgi:CubicO group peptidase (beta-lactamase class C family)